jgi:hypothetical protein
MVFETTAAGRGPMPMPASMYILSCPLKRLMPMGLPEKVPRWIDYRETPDRWSQNTTRSRGIFATQSYCSPK